MLPLTKHAILLSLFCLLAGRARGQEPGLLPKESWAEYVSPDKRFRVTMPGKPEFQKYPVPRTEVVMTLHLVDLKTSAFLVSYYDIPPDQTRVSPEARLDAVAKGTVEKPLGRSLIKATSIDIDGYPGQELVIQEAKEGHTILRLYMVEERFYMVSAVGKDFTDKHPDVVKFFSSLKIKYPVRAAATSFDGLLGYWSFDDEDAKAARDSAGGAHHAAIHGGKRIAGIRGKAIQFDGKARLDFGRARRFDFRENGQFTFTGWFQTTNTKSGALLRLRNPRVPDEKGEPSELFFGFRDNKLIAFLPDRSGQWHAQHPDIAVDRKLNDGRWHHFALLLDDSRHFWIYIDGQLVAGESFGRPVDLKTSERVIGDSFEGKLDEVALFNRRLKLDEIKALYGKDYNFEDKARPPLKLAAEMDRPDPIEHSFMTGQGTSGIAFDPSGKYLIGSSSAYASAEKAFFFDTLTGGLWLPEIAPDGKISLRLAGREQKKAYDLNSTELKALVAAHVVKECRTPDQKHRFEVDGKTVRKVDLGTSKTVAAWTLPRGIDGLPPGHLIYTARVEGIAVRDGTGVTMLSAANGMVLWSQPLGDEPAAARFRSMQDMALSPDGKQLACLVSTFDPNKLESPAPYTLYVVDVKTGQATQALEGSALFMSRVAYSPNGAYVVLTGRSGIVEFWRAADWKHLASVPHSRTSSYLAFSADGQHLVAYAGYAVDARISIIHVGTALNFPASDVKAP